MQRTVALRAAKHMRVIGLLQESICQQTEQQQTAGMQHPDLDTPAWSALPSTEMCSAWNRNLCENEMLLHK